MKAIVSVFVAAATVSVAGAAFAADPTVTLNGVVSNYCTLPSVWKGVSSNGGANVGNFVGTTWTIPSSALVGANGLPTPNSPQGDYAIRIRGEGSCNTSHQIKITSEYGGLVAGGAAGATNPPAGFSNRRAMDYRAHWRDRGPIAQIANAVAPSDAGQADYVVGNGLLAPGVREFDIRMGVVLNSSNLPMVAGVYSDRVIVTLSPTP